MQKRQLIPGKDRPARPDDAPRLGRPTNDAIRARQIEEICERHANGEALPTICKAIKPEIKPATFRGWVRADPELDERWKLVRKEYVHSLFDMIADLSSQLADPDWNKAASPAQVNAVKGAIEAYKHICGRLNSREYGEQKIAGAQLPTFIIASNLTLHPGEATEEAIDTDYTLALPPPQAKTDD